MDAVYFEETTTYALAAVLDPRFKVRWSSNNAEKNNCTRMLKSAADTIIALTADEGASSSNDSQPPPKKPKQDKSLFNFMEKNNALETTADVTEEIDKYLMAPCQPRYKSCRLLEGRATNISCSSFSSS